MKGILRNLLGNRYIRSLLILSFSFLIFDMGTVFGAGVPINDSPWKASGRIYAATSVHVPDNCNAYGGDDDHDGICNNWETTTNPGLHIDITDSGTEYKYNLSCNVGWTIANDPTGLRVCPRPDKQDIYVELDWMTSQDIDPQAIADVVSAFDKHGIALHIQYGETSTSGDIGLHYCNIKLSGPNGPVSGAVCNPPPSAPNTNAQNLAYLKPYTFGNTTERDGSSPGSCPLSGTGGVTPSDPPAAYNCLTAKRQVFHYAILVDYQLSDKTSSGYGEHGTGNDVIVSLGNFGHDSTLGKGTIDEQEAALMHELGHNLGLYHGGAGTSNENEDNCKPNYLSIMSYTYEFRRTFQYCRPLDYSDRVLTPALNEQSLTESTMGSQPYPTDNPAAPSGTSYPGDPTPPTCDSSGFRGTERQIIWSAPSAPNPRYGQTNANNDWNGGSPNSGYQQNLNNIPPFQCTSTTNTNALTGHDDWGSFSQSPYPLRFRNGTNFWGPGLPADDTDKEYANADDYANDLEQTPAPIAPDTIIDTNVITNSDITFTFHSDRTDSTFECSLDGAGFTTCPTPQTYPGLGAGAHKFDVRAVANVADPTPAEYNFTIRTIPQGPVCSEVCGELKNYMTTFGNLINFLVVLVAVTLAIAIAILIMVIRRRR